MSWLTENSDTIGAGVGGVVGFGLGGPMGAVVGAGVGAGLGGTIKDSPDGIQPMTASSQEEALNQMIMDSLQSSNALSEALMPYMMAEMGYSYLYTPGADGGKPAYTITKIPWEERLKGMSPQEQQQYKMQDRLINQQFAAMGYNPDTLEQFKTEEESWNYMSPQQLLASGVDPTTKTRMTDEQKYARLDEIGKLQYDVQKESLGLQAKGLRGELPISPGLERDLAKGQELTGADLSQRLGPNWKQSTAGIQTMGKFEESANIARDAARRGWLGDTAGMASGVGNDIRANKTFNQNSVGAVSPNLGLLGGLYSNSVGNSAAQQGQNITGLSGMPSYGQNWQGYQTAMQPYQYYSGLANQTNMQNAANDAQWNSGKMQLLGSLIGAGGMMYGLKK